MILVLEWAVPTPFVIYALFAAYSVGMLLVRDSSSYGSISSFSSSELDEVLQVSEVETVSGWRIMVSPVPLDDCVLLHLD